MPTNAKAQCYTFMSGTTATLTLSITNTTGNPSTHSDGHGGLAYTYTLNSLSGNSWVLTTSTGQYAVTSSSAYTIAIDSNASAPASGFGASVTSSSTSPLVSASISMPNNPTAFLVGGLPTVLPPVIQWPLTPVITWHIGSTPYGPYNVTSISSECSPPPPPKTLGECDCDGNPTPGQATAADPITIATGNLFEKATDYTTSGQNPLAFRRYYNSMSLNSGTYANTLGGVWRSNYDRYLQNLLASGIGATVVAERPDGKGLTFTYNGSAWLPDTDVDYTLAQSGATWTLTDHNDTVETYTSDGTGKGILNSIKLRNGYTQTMSYSSGLLQTVTDSYSRTLTFAYSGGLLSTVTTPETTSLQYAFNANGALTTVTYPTSSATTLTYLYENTLLPLALTGITDENGNRYATWGYDSQGRAISNQMGGTLAANLTTINYSTSTPVVTNALAVSDTYTFTTLQGVPKLTGISRAATSNTAAASRSFTYDTNGYLATATDWNGNQNNYTNNSHGQPTSVVEAYGSGVSRTSSITYDATWLRLPASIVTSGLTTSFTYDASGNVQTKTETDTTTGTVPYSTSGTARTWTNAYTTTGQLTSVTGPLTGQTTAFAYTGGTLTSITDALSHVTTINTYTGGGLPTKITDPNSVVTNITYDGRQRLLTSALSTTGGTLTTSSTYDSAGNLTKVTQPDGSYLATTFDNAHRPTKVTNALGEYISYTLDALGDRTAINTYNSSSTLKRQHSATFDNLGRILTDVGGVSVETTSFAYDNNGNPTSITDPRSHTTTKTYDALNRLSHVTDRTSGVTITTYNAHNSVLTVTDPNTNVTTYTRDGFERPIQTVSPDSGTTVDYFDLADNMTKNTDGAGIVTNRTFDKLNRELTRTFPAHTAENVSKTYDQTTGHGFGIGRLTSVTDQAGSLSNSYDERGNNTFNQRLNGYYTLDVYSYYDNASRLIAYTSASGYSIAYTRDAQGQVTGIGWLPPGVYSGATPVISSVTHLPFGPVASLSFANGVNRTTTFDLDYRMTNVTDQGTATIMNLTYGFDNNSNVTGITDAVNAANTQTLGYDNMDRLNSATASGTGGYGSYSWTYDVNGNRKTETTSSGTVNYSYVSGTNRLASRSDSTSTNYTYNNAGENTLLYFGSYLDLTNAFDQSERLYTPTFSGYGLPSFYALYDADGQRQSKSSNVFWNYVYRPDGSLIEEGNTVGQNTYYIYLDGQPIALLGLVTSGGTTTETTYAIHADRLGTPQVVTNPSQGLEWKDIYQPFGKDSPSSAGNVNQHLRFLGQYFDSETQLNHNGAREYDPTQGRYIQTDPIGLAARTTNTYGYAGQNPFRFRDKSGLAEGVDPLGNSFIDSDPLCSYQQCYYPAVTEAALRQAQLQAVAAAQLPLLAIGDEAALLPFLSSLTEESTIGKAISSLAPCAGAGSNLLNPSLGGIASLVASSMGDAFSYFPWLSATLKIASFAYDNYDYAQSARDSLSPLTVYEYK